jgi:hypothetical protein
MEPQMITVSLELFNKMFSVLTQLPFQQVNGLIVEIQQEISKTQAKAQQEAKQQAVK